MSYLNFNDPDFLLKVIDCYYKKTYLKDPNKQGDDFVQYMKDVMSGKKKL